MGLKSRFVRTRYRRIARLRRNRWSDRITHQLMLVEEKELDLHRRDDLRQAFIVVALAARGDPQPLVTASYRMFGVHPDLVFAHISAKRHAKLGREYGQWFDDAGNLKPQGLDIPDYDPTSELAAHWPGKRDSVRDPGLAPQDQVA